MNDRDLDLDLWLCTRCKQAPAEPGENHCGACARELEEIEPKRAEEVYRSALAMIARHPCWAADKERPDWHCGECASCVAGDALRGIA